MNRNEGFDIHETHYRVIYTWNGQRHVDLRTYNSIKSAAYRVNELRADGWNAWAEAI